MTSAGTTPTRIVIRAPNWLGDAVMALPAMAAVRAGYPGASLAVAAISSVAPLFLEQTPVDQDEVLTVDPRTEQAQLRNVKGAAHDLRHIAQASPGGGVIARAAVAGCCRDLSDGRARTCTRQRTTSTSRVVWISPRQMVRRA